MPPSLPFWENPPTHLTLPKHQLHLWRFRLDLPAAASARLSRILSRDEVARAERLLDPEAVRCFVAARGQLRQVLGRYLDCSPGDLRFAYGEHGKPLLVGTAAETLTFNLSHAGDWGVVAVARGYDVGVDIEKIDRRLAYEKIAPRFFSAEELVALSQYGGVRRRRIFYRLWTRKEAWLKALGCGLSASTMSHPGIQHQTRLFTVDRGYLGAFAATVPVSSVRRWC